MSEQTPRGGEGGSDLSVGTGAAGDGSSKGRGMAAAVGGWGMQGWAGSHPLIRVQGDWEETWGETYSKKRIPALFIVNISKYVYIQKNISKYVGHLKMFSKKTYGMLIRNIMCCCSEV
jgi:hypothetical protein